MITLEGPRGVAIMGQAAVIDETRELAWAERSVRFAPDIAWVQGNFVCADTPNYNGHIFPLEDLKTAHTAIANRPLNLLHQHDRIVGVYTDSELLYPTSATGASAEAEAAAAPTVPYVDTVAAFYKFYFPETFKAVQQAHSRGNLYMSMECVPKTLTCAGNGDGSPGCGRDFAYKGRSSDTYCSHLNEPGAHKIMNKPRFTAGALVLPPSRPGWKDADVTQLGKLMDDSLHGFEIEAAYEQIAGQAPHLGVTQWEQLMSSLVTIAFPDVN